MTYTELDNILQGIQKCNKNAFEMLEVLVAVKDNIDLSPYDNEGFDELCRRIHDFWRTRNYLFDIGDFCYSIQQVMESDEGMGYEFIDNACLKHAWNLL